MKDYKKSNLCKKIKEIENENDKIKKNLDNELTSLKNQDEEESMEEKPKLGVYKGSYRDSLFSQYANNIRDMIKFFDEKQDNLMKIIDKIFVIYFDPLTNKKHIRVDPELNMSSLDNIISNARQTIVELYLTCQEDFKNGLKMYEAIVDSITAGTVKNQIDKLENIKNDLISSDYSSHSDEESEEKQLNSYIDC
jgi:hypothetical protein